MTHRSVDNSIDCAITRNYQLVFRNGVPFALNTWNSPLKPHNLKWCALSFGCGDNFRVMFVSVPVVLSTVLMMNGLASAWPSRGPASATPVFIAVSRLVWTMGFGTGPVRYSPRLVE